MGALALMPGFFALMAGSPHDVILPVKIPARSHAFKLSFPCVPRADVGTEWNTPIAPSANGTCTILRPVEMSEA